MYLPAPVARLWRGRVTALYFPGVQPNPRGTPLGNARTAGHDLGRDRPDLFLHRADLGQPAPRSLPDSAVHHPAHLGHGRAEPAEGGRDSEREERRRLTGGHAAFASGTGDHARSRSFFLSHPRRLTLPALPNVPHQARMPRIAPRILASLARPALAALLVAVALIPRPAAAQFLWRPDAHWQTLRTPHFTVVYPREFEDWARTMAERLESVRSAVGAEVGSLPRKPVTVLVTD